MRTLALILAVALGAAGCATAGGGRTKEDGERFARRACAGCHAIGGTGGSGYWPSPPFRTLEARLPGAMLETRLSEIAAKGHRQMPPIYMTPDEIAAVARYIRAVAGPDRGPERRAAVGLVISPGRAISGA